MCRKFSEPLLEDGFDYDSTACSSDAPMGLCSLVPGHHASAISEDCWTAIGGSAQSYADPKNVHEGSMCRWSILRVLQQPVAYFVSYVPHKIILCLTQIHFTAVTYFRASEYVC